MVKKQLIIVFKDILGHYVNHVIFKVKFGKMRYMEDKENINVLIVINKDFIINKF